MSRGNVNNQRRFRQNLLYGGIRYAKITPTDVDAFIDFRDKLYVFVEVKYKDKPIDMGQRIAIERLCDSSHCPPKRHSIALHCQHNVDIGDVYLKDTRVVACYYAGKWVAKDALFTDAVDALVEKHAPELMEPKEIEKELKPEPEPVIQYVVDMNDCPF